MQLMSIILGALTPIERSRWQFKSLRRQIAERGELQLRRLLDWLQGSDSTFQDAPDWLGPLLMWLLRAAAVVIVCSLLYWGIKAVISLFNRRRRRQSSITATQQTSIETQTLQDWLAQAAAAQSQQDYATACRALYMALLVQLEKTEWLAQNPALTDQEYLRRLDSLWVLYPQAAELPQAWSQLFQTHELICYGAQDASLERFQRCQQAYQRLASELAPCRPVVP
ncbi:hypothetical protein C1752_02229 [Acaryochloris thomasi RCC1774]|uniref:Protein-glutamine gamma-glutamyltransferase-like C-terminal domain-containing protein n=1 Tax=Acaryochloris thomasi RCC1774 TaxID=1764569 RepID=A0A2W1JXB4_9CYAN|nr:DUF4129 domain-containing protein [Acaryochloris thomasi]PZD73291.1 hypothetical protein C1752_02229 [Acaryochloris thomasi RCC1774]